MGQSTYNTDVFNTLDALFIIFSLITYLAALSTDVIVGVDLLALGDLAWGVAVLVIAALATVVMAITSLSWYLREATQESRCMKWLSHLSLMAPVYRYVEVLTNGIDAQRSPTRHNCEVYFQSVRNASVIRLIEAFLQSAPQLGVQLYIIIAMDRSTPLMWTSVCMSALSIGMSMACHITAKHLRYNDQHELNWPSSLVLLVWHFAMVAGRVVAIVVFTHAFAYWTILALGVHWVAMYIWMCALNPHPSYSRCTARALDLIISYIHIFCFYKTTPGHTRLRVFIYYLVVLIENALFVGLWNGLKPSGATPNLVIMIVVFGGFLLAVLLMFLYYGCCHKGGRFSIGGVAGGPFFQKHNCFSNQDNTYARNPSPCDISDENFTKPHAPDKSKKQKHHKNTHKSVDTASSTASDQYLIHGRQNQLDDKRDYRYHPDHHVNRRNDKLYTITTSVGTYNDGRYSPSVSSSGKVSISPLDASKLWETSSERCLDSDDRRYYDHTADNTTDSNRQNWDGGSARLNAGDSIVNRVVEDVRRNARSVSPAIEARQVGRAARANGPNSRYPANHNDAYVDRMEYKKRPSYMDDDNYVDRMEYKKRMSNNSDTSMMYSKLNTGKYPTDDPDLVFDGRVGIHDSMISKRNSHPCNESITTPMRKNRGFVSPSQADQDPGNAMYRRILKGMANPRDSIEEYTASPYKSSERLNESSNQTLATLAKSHGEPMGRRNTDGDQMGQGRTNSAYGDPVGRTTSKEQLAEITRRMSADDSDYSDEIVSYLDKDKAAENNDNLRSNSKDKDVTKDMMGSKLRHGNRHGDFRDDLTTENLNAANLGHAGKIQHEYIPGNDILSSLVTEGDVNAGSANVQRTESVSQPGNDVMKSLIASDKVDDGGKVKGHPATEDRQLSRNQGNDRIASKPSVVSSKPPVVPAKPPTGLSKRRKQYKVDDVDSDVERGLERSDSLKHAGQVTSVFVPGNEMMQTFVAADGTPCSDATSSDRRVKQKGNSVMQDLVSESRPRSHHETDIDDVMQHGGKENVEGRKEGQRTGKGQQGRRGERRERRPFGSVNQPSVRL